MSIRPRGVRVYESTNVREYEGGCRIRENGPLTTDYGPLTTEGGEGCGIDWNTKSMPRYGLKAECGIRNAELLRTALQLEG